MIIFGVCGGLYQGRLDRQDTFWEMSKAGIGPSAKQSRRRQKKKPSNKCDRSSNRKRTSVFLQAKKYFEWVDGIQQAQ